MSNATKKSKSENRTRCGNRMVKVRLYQVKDWVGSRVKQGIQNGFSKKFGGKKKIHWLVLFCLQVTEIQFEELYKRAYDKNIVMSQKAGSVMWLSLKSTWNQDLQLFFFLFFSVGLFHFLSFFLQTSCIAALANMVGKTAIKSSGVWRFTVQARKKIVEFVRSLSFKIPKKRCLTLS